MQNKAWKSRKVPKRGQKCKKVEHCWHFWQLFGKIYKFVCRSDSVRQTTFLFFCSDSVQQTKFLFVTVTQCNKKYCQKKIILLVAYDKGIGKKAKNKHPSKFEFHLHYQIALEYSMKTVISAQGRDNKNIQRNNYKGKATTPFWHSNKWLTYEGWVGMRDVVVPVAVQVAKVSSSSS